MRIFFWSVKTISDSVDGTWRGASTRSNEMEASARNELPEWSVLDSLQVRWKRENNTNHQQVAGWSINDQRTNVWRVQRELVSLWNASSGTAETESSRLKSRPSPSRCRGRAGRSASSEIRFDRYRHGGIRVHRANDCDSFAKATRNKSQLKVRVVRRLVCRNQNPSRKQKKRNDSSAEKKPAAGSSTVSTAKGERGLKTRPTKKSKVALFREQNDPINPTPKLE